LNSPLATAVASTGELFIMERSNRVRKVALDGAISTLVQLPISVDNMSMTPSGELLVSGGTSRVIYRVKQSGEFEQFALFGVGLNGDGVPADEARIWTIASTVEAPDGRIFIADHQMSRVWVLTRSPRVFEGGIKQAASFVSGSMAAETIVSVFGINLADETLVAQSTPLPTSLGGSTVVVRDSAGVERAADLFFVSDGQINLMIPAGTVMGPATLFVRTSGGNEATFDFNIVTANPGLFATNANGSGVAAALWLRVDGAGVQTNGPVFEFDSGGATFVGKPIDLGPADDQVFLLLFGTGIRGAGGAANVTASINGIAVPVLFAGDQGGFVGLDQINIGPIPRSLIGAGEVEIQIVATSKLSHVVTVTIGGAAQPPAGDR